MRILLYMSNDGPHLAGDGRVCIIHSYSYSTYANCVQDFIQDFKLRRVEGS